MTTLELYRAAIAADEAFEAALQAEGFESRWGHRDWNFAGNARVETAYAAKRAADDRLHAVYADLHH